MKKSIILLLFLSFIPLTIMGMFRDEPRQNSLNKKQLQFVTDVYTYQQESSWRETIDYNDKMDANIQKTRANQRQIFNFIKNKPHASKEEYEQHAIALNIDFNDYQTLHNLTVRKISYACNNINDVPTKIRITANEKNELDTLRIKCRDLELENTKLKEYCLFGCLAALAIATWWVSQTHGKTA